MLQSFGVPTNTPMLCFRRIWLVVDLRSGTRTTTRSACNTILSLFSCSTQVDPSPQCEGLFQLFDADRSGQIDVREFMISLTNFAGASKDDKLKFAFMIFDEDGNGVITKQEASCVGSLHHLHKFTEKVVTACPDPRYFAHFNLSHEG